MTAVCDNLKPGTYSASAELPTCTLPVDHEGPHFAVVAWTSGTVEHKWLPGYSSTNYRPHTKAE